MNRRCRWLPRLGTSLLLVIGGAVPEGLAEPAGNAAAPLYLAQAHEHGQQGGGGHAPALAPQQSAAEPREGAPEGEPPAVLGQQHMMMPHAPMHDMPDMTGMEHAPGAEEVGDHDMSPVDVSGAPAAGAGARGGQLLQPTVRDGVNEFALSTGVVRWYILPDVDAGTYAYNGQIPGPLIRVQPHERVRLRVRNDLPEGSLLLAGRHHLFK